MFRILADVDEVKLALMCKKNIYFHVICDMTFVSLEKEKNIMMSTCRSNTVKCIN